MTRPSAPQHYPRQVPIDAYGNGGFRFAEMSHKGSILCLPSGIRGVDAAGADLLALSALAMLKGQADVQTVLLLGTGKQQIFPKPETRQAFADAGIGLEAMDTGAACRTYNILLAERRPVAAALMVVE